jgi:hypothetical protein
VLLGKALLKVAFRQKFDRQESGKEKRAIEIALMPDLLNVAF